MYSRLGTSFMRDCCYHGRMRPMKQGPAAERKKVLFLITKSNFGGAQRYVYDLATSLPKDRFEIVVALGGTGKKDAGAGILKERIEAMGIRTIFINSFMRDISLAREWRALFELITLFKSEHPDVVHLNSSKAGGLGALAARIAGIRRIIFTAHGWPFWEDRNPVARSIIFLLSYATVLLSHATICISEHDRRTMANMPFAKRKLYVIHNGIPSIAFLSRDEARAKLLSPEEIAAHKDDVWIISNGELHPNKNYFIGIDAVARHNKTSEKKIFYSIMGSGELKETIGAYIREKHLEGTVRLLGFVSDGRTYLHGFDLFFLPSKKEGIPYVILEAGMARLPVVASDAGGIPEVIEDGVSGLLRKPDDVAGFAETFSRTAADPEKSYEMSALLHKRVADDFSIETMIKKTTELY